MNLWHFILLTIAQNIFDSSEASSVARSNSQENTTKIRIHPYIAKIWTKDKFLGSATILTPKWVLTAAACLDKIDPKTAHVRDGDQSISNGKMFSIEKIDVHPEYDGKSNDIAMVKIKGSFSIPVARSAVAKIDRKLKEPDTNYKDCVILSWGVGTKNGSAKARSGQKGNLQSTNMNLKKFSDCQMDWKFINKKSHLCGVAAKKDAGACFGDAGGPLMCAGVQVGITSYGRVNCGSTPWYTSGTVFTRVFTFQKWITDHFTDNK